MARTKWIFGQQQNQPARDSTNQAVIPSISSADAKKFGLENFGNTCYANSVIQALYFCAPFRDLLIQSEDHSLSQIALEQPPQPAPPPPPTSFVPVRKKTERKQTTSGSSQDVPNGVAQPNAVLPIPSSPKSLFSALRSLFVHISLQPTDKGTVAPRAFIDKLRELNDQFRSTMHQDAHEFLNYLLNKIVEEIEEDRKVLRNSTPVIEDMTNSIATLTSPPTVQTASSNSGSSPREATLVHKLFEGVLTSETRCLTCETVSSRDESFLDLSIDIEQNASVTACLRQFSASEMLCQKNKFFCDSCCDLQEAEKRMKIKKLPNVLALHLKRFKYQEDVQKYIKLAYRVAFPFELRLFNTVDDTDDTDRLFNLFGIVVHIGNGPHHGHYISIIKTQGSWQVFDDDNVLPIAEADIPKYFGESNAGAAYVLYYQAADIDLTALGLRNLPEPTEIVSEPTLPLERLVPVRPPGLVDEADSSDLSDPADPVTPSHSSPLLSFVDKPRQNEMTISIDELQPDDSSYASPLPITPTTGSTRQKLFSIPIRRTPSTSAKFNAGTSGSLGSTDPPPVPELPSSIQANGKVKESNKEPERKPSIWFPKRKSFKATERKSASESDPLPSSPNTLVGDNASPAPSSPYTWFRTTNQPKDKRRRPSEPSVFDGSGFAPPPPPARPKSSVFDTVNLSVKPDKKEYDSPTPGSSTSSTGSVVQPSVSPVPPSPIIVSPPERISSIDKKHFDHKKSLSNLPREPKSISPPPPRPSTSPGVKPDVVRLLPPIPPLPPSVSTPAPETLVDEPEQFIFVDDGKPIATPDGQSPPMTFSEAPPSSNPLNQNVKRATRKLSMTGPILGLGFGKKDKKEKENGKGPPSAFGQLARF